jgi:hypothetical protein
MKMPNQSLRSAFANSRSLFGLTICLAGISLALIAFASNSTEQGRTAVPINKRPGAPDVYRMIGPASLDQDIRTLRDVPQNGESEERRLLRFSRRRNNGPERFDPVRIVREAMQAPMMPGPIATYPGIGPPNGCACVPPDANGDVGPNHYIEAVSQSFEILDKNGNLLAGPTSYNSFFSGLVGTPCSNANAGEPIVFYDHLADRWVISDLAFPSFPGSSFYECVAVSRTSDPVVGGWWLYAIQTDPANPTYMGDYPKFGLWPDAYYFTANLFSNAGFAGFRVCALNRNSMINGGPANAIAFNVSAANAGLAYCLVPAGFRTGSPPPAGRDEFLFAIDSPSSGGVILNQVHAWKFHVDFVNPANSTFGIGPNHQPNAEITVNGFTDAFTNASSDLVPQPGTTRLLDTVGDRIMYPLVYQNLGGVESLWASHTVNNNQNGTGPMAVRWYQMNVTGGSLPTTPTQQGTWDNGADGIFRWMPSIAVDSQGNMAIGYSASSSSVFPSIRYAGRLATDPPNTLAQGEAIMTPGGGSQTLASSWGAYSMTAVDPVDGMTFWHVNEYYLTSNGFDWATRIGKFRFSQPLVLQSAVSRKVHGSAGPFDILLPGIECRTGNPTIVVTFSNNVVSGNAAVTTGVATVNGSPVFSGNTMTINLTGVANAQTLTVTLSNVMDTFGQTLPVTSVNMSMLTGDANGNGVVNAADVAQTKAQAGQIVSGSNFRADMNANGAINSGDVAIVKSKLGTGLP